MVETAIELCFDLIKGIYEFISKKIARNKNKRKIKNNIRLKRRNDMNNEYIKKEDIVNSALLEKFSELSHEQWSGWMMYLFSKCEAGFDGSMVIPKLAVERWARQMNTPYSDLTNEEKASDRREAIKFLNCLNKDL